MAEATETPTTTPATEEKPVVDVLGEIGMHADQESESTEAEAEEQDKAGEETEEKLETDTKAEEDAEEEEEPAEEKTEEEPAEEEKVEEVEEEPEPSRAVQAPAESEIQKTVDSLKTLREQLDKAEKEQADLEQAIADGADEYDSSPKLVLLLSKQQRLAKQVAAAEAAVAHYSAQQAEAQKVAVASRWDELAKEHKDLGETPAEVKKTLRELWDQTLVRLNKKFPKLRTDLLLAKAEEAWDHSVALTKAKRNAEKGATPKPKKTASAQAKPPTRVTQVTNQAPRPSGKLDTEAELRKGASGKYGNLLKGIDI